MSSSTELPVLKLSSKLPDVGSSIFYEMTRLAQQHQAINLGQGFPGFQPDARLVQAVHQAMLDGHNQYAPMAGVPALREELSRLCERKNGRRYEPETEITITSGATEALYAVISAVVWPEDEVIVFDPAYESYVPAIRANGGQPVHIPLSYPDYRIDWNKVKRLITSKTRAIILNNPHNPSGQLLDAADIEALRSITRDSDMLIISDEVYEHIVFNGQPHLSMAQYDDLAARSFVIGSLGKTLHTTGWKIGYCMAPAALTQELRRFHQQIVFAVSTPMQVGTAAYLASQPTLAQDLKTLFGQKRDRFNRLMKGSRLKPIPSQGSYFQLYSFRELEGLSALSDVEFCRQLISQHGVAAIPISVFYRDQEDQKVIRLCFAKEDAVLDAAAERLCAV
ncbi:MAG: methionine aminotransferase [Sphingobacteriia bacterium]|jgi:methionine aminotransferase